MRNMLPLPVFLIPVLAIAFVFTIVAYAQIDTSTISMITLPFTGNAALAKQSLDQSISIYNHNTGSSLSHYTQVPSINEQGQKSTSGQSQQYATSAFQDRYGLRESNNDLNIFLRATYAGDAIESIRGIELGSDSITVGIQNSNTTLPNSAEIKIPQNSISASIPQKTVIPIGATFNTPRPVSDFLSSRIDLVDKSTSEHVVHYAVLQTTHDAYAQNMLNINNQNVTTVGFDDRYGRSDDGDDLNVFLQISHTGDKVNSLRGVSLDDDIEVFVNGVDEGTLSKAVEIWATSSPAPALITSTAQHAPTSPALTHTVPTLIPPITPTPTTPTLTTPTPRTAGQPLSLLFVQYPSATDAPQVQRLMQQYLTAPTDYIQVEKNNLYQDFTSQRKLMVEDSLQGIQGRINAANTIGIPIYAIAYDFEHWTQTPASEQADPVGSMNAAATAVHNAGYKFGYAPDSKYLNDNYKAYNWKNVDVAWLQVGYNQYLYSNYAPFITDVINTIKTENPNCIIIVQLALSGLKDKTFSDPVSQFNAEVDLANSLNADAISIVYLDQSKSPNYTISNLQAILAHIATLK